MDVPFFSIFKIDLRGVEAAARGEGRGSVRTRDGTINKII
jgi:hypothetical protein